MHIEVAYPVNHSLACEFIVFQVLFAPDESQGSWAWEEMLVPFPEADATIALTNSGVLWGFDCELHSSAMAISVISLKLGSWG